MAALEQTLTTQYHFWIGCLQLQVALVVNLLAAAEGLVAQRLALEVQAVVVLALQTQRLALAQETLAAAAVRLTELALPQEQVARVEVEFVFCDLVELIPHRLQQVAQQEQ
jgi:hypothetical protein